MTTRPPLSSRTTAFSGSDASHAPSLFSTSHHSGQTTAMTSPELGTALSPKKGWLHGTGAGKMDQMLTVFETDERSSRRTTMAVENYSGASNDGSRRPSASLGRGPSVKDRANAWENTTQPQAGPSTPPESTRRPLPNPDFLPVSSGVASPGGTAPLHVTKRPSPAPSSVTPTNPQPSRRVPVPTSAPQQRTGYFYDEPETMSSLSARRSPDLKRGKGSAKNMIKQWENRPVEGAGPSTGYRPVSPSPQRRLPSTGLPLQPSKRVYSKDYLDAKPLPVPSATPLPSSNYYSPAKSYTPQAVTPTKQQHRPSPLQHLQTPTQRTSYQSTSPTSPSQYSFSTSPSSGRLKGKSPLKGMLDKFGGGIRDVGRKMKGKSKEKFGRSRESLGGSSREDLHFWEEPRNERLGTSGLPGGIVFNDRMGDQEMSGKGDTSDIIRSSSVIYLIPTPCSSVSPWGSWLASFATLTNEHLRITYCPVFPPVQSGHSTPRRLLSGTHGSSSYSSIPFNAIPLPAAGQDADVEMNMKDCVEVRSLRREEIKGRGIPPAPEGIGTEVLEMVWNDGGKRYLGVEGVGGRLGWVSAIWDVLLACQSSNPISNLPPPSPITSSIKTSTVRKLPQPISPLGSFALPSAHYEPPPELAAFRNRIASLERLSYAPDPPQTSAPPVQKVGDAWVGASVIASTELGIDRAPSAEGLRDSVHRMFEKPPVPPAEQQQHPEPTIPPRQDEAADPMSRVKAWQQPDATTQHLSIFRLARGTLPPTEIDEPMGKTDTLLSFDPNDLNPSRSASQVRRQTTVLGGVEGMRRRFEPQSALQGIEESSDSASTAYLNTKPPTHISHVTFPKPTMGGQRIGGYHQPLSPHIEGTESGSTLGGDDGCGTTSGSGTSAELRTPQTVQDSMTTLTTQSGMDHTVLAKLEDHSTEHNQLGTQLGGVQGDLQKVIGTLTSLVAGAGLERTAAKEIEGKLDTVALDVKAIENALNLNSLSMRVPPSLAAGEEEGMDGKVPDVHRKLDAIAKLCEDLLARPAGVGGVGAVGGAAVKEPAKSPSLAASAAMARKGSLGITVDATEEKEAGEEVAAIMTDPTGGSTKASPRVGGIQVLHNLSKPPSPADQPLPPPADVPDDTRKQVGEVLTLVRDLKDARALQTQQTTDIARYLSELNSWLEKFVVNSTKELTGLNTRLTSLVGPEEAPAGPDDAGAPRPPIGLPDLVADMHAMVSEQKRRAESEGMVGMRLDTLLQMMGEEKERHATQQNTVEQVAGLLQQQRQDNEFLLRALATDLTSEIRGERLRFVEAMQQATSVNVNLHVEEFKKLLGTEVAKSMQELGQMREEKKALEQNISDLFALKAKHGMNSRANTKKSGTAPASPAASSGRGLPVTPGGRPK